MKLSVPPCPSCGAKLRWASIRTFFACHKCGASLMSNYATCGFAVSVFCFIVSAFTLAICSAVYNYSDDAAKLWALMSGGIAFAISAPAGLASLRIYLSPVRFRGVEVLDADSTSRMGTAATKFVNPVKLPPTATAQLSQAQLAAWRSGAHAFASRAHIGLVLVVAGLIGLGGAVVAAFESLTAGALTFVLSTAAIFGGYFHNRRLALRYLLCPQCGEYPAGLWINSQIPAFLVRELGGLCVHCGSALPLDP